MKSNRSCLTHCQTVNSGRIRTCIFLLGCFLISSLSAESPETIQIPYEKFVLDNGLRLIVHEDHKAPIVAVSVWYHVGSKDEPEGKTGFAHLFEHIMFEGSENYNDRFSKPLEQVGATSLNGTTWFDRTNYLENVPTPALELALFLESDRMGHLLGVVTQEKLDQERGVVQNEKRQGDNQPYGMTSYRILEGLFPPGHPYRHDTIGSMEDLDAASLDDVHDWFNQYYGASNTVIVLAGDIVPEEALELVKKYFGDIQAGPTLRKMTDWVPDRVANTHETMYDNVAQVRSYQYWAVPGRTKQDRALLELAAQVLGDGKNSRLYQALIHETQHATNLSVSVEAQELASMFSIDTRLRDGAALENVNNLIRQELNRFISQGPTEEELTRAKTKINASVIRGLELVGGFSGKAVTLAEGELYDGNPGFVSTLLNWINAADAEDVRLAANRWLADGRYQLDVLPSPEFTTAEAGYDRSKGLPETGELPELSFPEIRRATLKNGIKVVLTERSAVPVVDVSIQFDAGHAADAKLKLGTSSYTLAMLDESTTNRTSLEINAETESLGAEITTGSNLDASTISLSALKSKLEPSIELFADVVRNPAFTPAEMERMRVNRMARVKQEKAQPVGIALMTLPRLIYGADHAYGIPFRGTGTEASNQAITREELIDFHRQWFRPDNASIFVVGDATMAEMLPLLEKHFGNWVATRSTKPEKKIPDVALPATGRLLLIDKPDSPQSLILAAHVVPSTGSERNIAIEAMNDVIGGTSSARVNQNLRVNKQWSYGSFTLLPDAKGQRPWLVYAAVQSDRTADSIKELIGEFNRFVSSEPANQDELVRVVRNNSFSLPGQYESNNAVMNALLSNSRFGRNDDYVPSLKDQYQSLSLEDIQSVAKDIIHPDKLIWVIVGNASEIQPSLEALDMGPVDLVTVDSVLAD